MAGGIISGIGDDGQPRTIAATDAHELRSTDPDVRDTLLLLVAEQRRTNELLETLLAHWGG